MLQHITMITTFIDKEIGHEESNLYSQWRVWNVRLCPFKCILFRVPLGSIDGETVCYRINIEPINVILRKYMFKLLYIL